MKKIITKVIQYFLHLPDILAKPDTQILFYTSLLRNNSIHLNKIVAHIQELKLNNSLNDFILDIGAYDGKTSVFFRKHFPQNPVLAFEPNPNIYQNALPLCKKYNIQLLPYAISDKNDIVKLHLTQFSPSSSILNVQSQEGFFQTKNSIEIHSKTIDSICEEYKINSILLQKLDIQGAELLALKGSEKSLRFSKFIVIEVANHSIYSNGCLYHEIDEYLRYRNFVLLDMMPSLYGFDLENYQSLKIQKFQCIEWNAIYANKSLVK